MLTRRYLASAKNLSAIFDQIRQGTAPERFTTQHLKDLGFASSNDRAVIPLLKDLGFLSDDGQPTNVYHEYRDTSRSRVVLGDQLRTVYGDLFTIKEMPSEADRPLIEGKFKSVHNVKERVAELQAATFYALLAMADLGGKQSHGHVKKEQVVVDEHKQEAPKPPSDQHLRTTDLRYNIEVHLPATKDIEVFNAIFKSLKEHLLD